MVAMGVFTSGGKSKYLTKNSKIATRIHDELG